MSLGKNQIHSAMNQAIELASRAEKEGDVPVGAVLLDSTGEILGRGWNTREARQNPLGHAEIMAIEEGAKALGSWRLTGTTLVVTLEPCVMCAGAIVSSRIERVVFGAFDRKAGGVCSLYAIPQDPRLNHRVELEGGVLEAECTEQLQAFFQRIRHSE